MDQSRRPAVRARARWKTEKDGFDVLNWVLEVAMNIEGFRQDNWIGFGLRFATIWLGRGGSAAVPYVGVSGRTPRPSGDKLSSAISVRVFLDNSRIHFRQLLGAHTLHVIGNCRKAPIVIPLGDAQKQLNQACRLGRNEFHVISPLCVAQATGWTRWDSIARKAAG
jgi:hypothetical protein